MIYQWTDANVEHIGEHQVTPDEAEEVVGHAQPPFPRQHGDDKFVVWGQTAAGRYLQVIFVPLSDDDVDFESLSPAERLRFMDGEGVGFIIHAMDLTADMKRQYRRTMR